MREKFHCTQSRSGAQAFFRAISICALVCAMPWALAQPSECGFIKDPDRQAYCRAVNGGSEAQCGFIRDSDLQARCRAESGGGAAQCGFIRDKDAQAACRASLQS